MDNHLHGLQRMVWKKKKRKHSVSGKSVCKKDMLFPEVRGGWPDWFKIERQRKPKLLVVITKVCWRASLNTQHVEPWSRWPTAAEDHAGYHFCKQRTGNWGYRLQGLAKSVFNMRAWIKWPPQSPVLSPVEQLLDAVEWEIHIMDEQQLCDVIISIWTKS